MSEVMDNVGEDVIALRGRKGGSGVAYDCRFVSKVMCMAKRGLHADM